MANRVIPIDRYEAKESGRAIQEAQNTVMVTGAAAIIALIRELLKYLKLPEKSANVKIAIDDSVAYRANAQAGKALEVNPESPALSEKQLPYLKAVVKLPQSNEPAAASIPLDKDVTITVDGKEVFRLKDGIVQKNLIAPAVVESDVPELKQVGVSLSQEQRQKLEKLGIDPQTVEKALEQKAQGTVPIIVVLNREVERNFSRSQLKDNLKSINSRFQKAVKDFSGKISSFLGSAREKLFPTTERAIKQDLQNLAVVNVASHLLDRFGSQTANSKQVFEGNSFRLERWDNNLTVTAKDGRGTILSLKDGELSGSLTAKDVEKFLAVERQLNRGRSRQSQTEIG